VVLTGGFWGAFLLYVHPLVRYTVFIVFPMEHVVHRTMAAYVRIPASHETATAWRANRVLAKSGGKRYCVRRDQCVNVRGLSNRIANVPEHVPAPLVRVEDDNVRSLFHAK